MGTEKKLWLIMAVFMGLAAYGVWNIFQPDVFPMSFVRGEARELSPGVLGGPYPTESELRVLARNGVTEVISLMDPGNVVEARLVEEERKLVAGMGLRFQNFPMDFQDMGSMKSVEGLEKALSRVSARGSQKVYVHCYLGRHRVGLLEAALKKTGPSPAP